MRYSSNNKKSVRKRFGFTLIEMLIVLSIMSLTAAFGISSYPKFSEQMSVTGETYKILSIFREVQSYGLAAFTAPGTKVVYSIVIDKSDNTIYRYKLENPVGTSSQYYITTSTLDSSNDPLVIKSLFEISEIAGVKSGATTTVDKAYIFFRRPNPESRLVGIVSDLIKPGVRDESFDRFEITLSSKRNNGFYKKVVILATGQMYVNDW